MAWGILFLAGLFEIGWAIGLKYTDGFSKPWPSLATLAAMGISMWLLAVSLKTLPVGTAYAVWVGIGAVGTFILGIFLLDEPVGFFRIASMAFVVVGLVGLKLSSSL